MKVIFLVIFLAGCSSVSFEEMMLEEKARQDAEIELKIKKIEKEQYRIIQKIKSLRSEN